MTSSSLIHAPAGRHTRAVFARSWPMIISSASITQAFLALGIVLRLRQYFFNRSLWLDESLLALNLITRTPSELLKPLGYHQGAPLGFLMLEKAVIRFLGSGEMALRLIPLLAGIASLFLFATAARRLLAPEAVPIAVGLFSICGSLVYYSSEAKQYSSDVAVALVLLLAASHLTVGENTPAKALALSIIAGLSIWFSQPAAFVVAAVGIVWLWVGLGKRDRLFPAAWVGFAIITNLSFGIYYLFSLRTLVRDEWLMGYWSGAFAPLPYSLSGIRWFANAWPEMCGNPLGLTFVGIATAAVVFGAMEIFRERPEKLMLLALPILLALAASALHRYPFRGRLLLFAVPCALLLLGAGLGAIWTKTRSVLPGFGSLLIVLMFLNPVEDAARSLVKPRLVEEIRPVLEYVQKHRTEGDILYCYDDAEPALKYYTSIGKISSMPRIVAVVSREDWTKYWADLDQLRGKPRVWVLFSHVYRDGGADEERLFLDYLDRMGARIDSVQAIGAAAYLYDLSTKQPSR
jgi:hypothetical protein